MFQLVMIVFSGYLAIVVLKIERFGNRWLLPSAIIYFVALAYSGTWNLDTGNVLVAAFHLGRVTCELCTFEVVLERGLVTCQQKYPVEYPLVWVSLSLVIP